MFRRFVPSTTSSFVGVFSVFSPSATSTTSSQTHQLRFCSSTLPAEAPSNPPIASEAAADAAKSLFKEREIAQKEGDQYKDAHHTRWGIDTNAVKDRQFDEQIEEELGGAATAKKSGDDFLSKMRVKVVMPEKPSAEQENRIPIKPNQPFNQAVRDALDKVRQKELEEEQAKKKQQQQQPQQQQQQQQQREQKPPRRRSLLEKTIPVAPPAPSLEAQQQLSKDGHTKKDAPVGAAVPKAPPLPGSSSGGVPSNPPPPLPTGGGGAGAAVNPNPSDDEICYHLRGVIERSAARISADITTMQLSLPQPMMDALAQRHGHSLRMFVAKFPARFQMDPNGLPRVHLVGVPGAPVSAQQFGRPSPAASPASSHPSASSASSSPSALPSSPGGSAPALKPIHPGELRKQQYEAHQQQLREKQRENQMKSGGSTTAAAAATPAASKPAPNSKLSAPSLPPLPKMPGVASSSSSSGIAGSASDPVQHAMESAFMTKTWRSPAEIVDNLMEYIPSYWVPMKAVHNHVPFEIKELYQNKMKLSQFLRKFNFYFDSKLTQRGAEVRVREDCKHPKKGAADDRYGQHQRRHLLQQEHQKAEFADRVQSPSSSPSSSSPSSASLNKPRYVDVDAHSLAGQLKQLCSNAFVPVKEFQAGLPNTITSHPEYDASAGVLPTLEKHPYIFQVADGAVRLRQAGVAPNALDKQGRDVADSPLPGIFAKVLQSLPEHPGDCSPVEIATIMAKLSSDERAEIRTKYRSFPRFLRLHGGAIEVSRDNTTLRRWEEPRSGADAAAAASSALDEAAELDAAGEVEDPFEPQLGDGAAALPRPGGVADASAVQWALKELYSNLPLSTAVPLEDAVSMLPAQMREAVQQSPTSISDELAKYPDYFMCWASPDDEKVFIVQRAMIGVPDFELDEVAATVKSLTPQGGIDAEKLLRRVPPRMQRYLFKHGLKTTLHKRPEEFLVVNDKVLSLS